MLEMYFSAPKTLLRLRAGPSGPYLDAFAGSLEADGYSHGVAARYLQAAAHLGHFLQRQGATLADIDLSTDGAFFQHLRACRCPISHGGKRNHHTYYGAKRYRDFLVRIGICSCRVVQEAENAEPPLVVGFRHWLEKHRGAAETTAGQYARCAVDVMSALGDDPAQWDAQCIRAHFIERTGRCGAGTAEKLVTNVRAFLRYLSVRLGMRLQRVVRGL